MYIATVLILIKTIIYENYTRSDRSAFSINDGPFDMPQSNINIYATKKNYTKCNITYKDAEFISDRFGEITGIDIAPEKFLHDKNQLADELLDDYQEYQSLLANYDENTRSMVIAFYQFLFYYRKLPHEVILSLEIALSAFLKYVSGNINKKELKKHISFKAAE